jgi:hypothetical protein
VILISEFIYEKLAEESVENHAQGFSIIANNTFNLERQNEGHLRFLWANVHKLYSGLVLLYVFLDLLHQYNGNVIPGAVFIQVANAQLGEKRAIILLGVENIVQIFHNTRQVRVNGFHPGGAIEFVKKCHGLQPLVDEKLLPALPSIDIELHVFQLGVIVKGQGQLPQGMIPLLAFNNQEEINLGPEGVLK